MKYQALNDKITELSVAARELRTPAEQVKALSTAAEVVNELIRILNPEASGLKTSEEILEDIISSNTFQNSKVEGWFAFHPIYPDERLALRFFENDLCEVKFYWLNDNSTKARISAGVMLTPNWEDREATENDSYRVGIDFFLKKDVSGLLMVISYRGNLRVMEFSGRLTHTQVEILDKIAGALTLMSKKAFHEVLWSALALNEVNKKFYEGVAKQFTILCQHLVASGKDKNDAAIFSSRLLGRLLFIWFLRKKGVVANEEKYFPAEIPDATEYYNKILKTLFFQTFNTPVHNRKNGDLDTPYLNGGLFEPHANDWAYEELSFPQRYFADLYEHLNKYNFTTDESSPDYEQVAIDPEMLGRVFESLLAEQRADTGEQARKAKGAFYTPREIVSYICKEALRQYLYTALNDEKYNAGVDKLLDLPDYEWETAHSNAKRDLWTFDKDAVRKVIGFLDTLTVLDPACGSGAFPMGMLHLLTKTYERLDPRFDPHKAKLGIIENNIFGVDIEPMAVEISRLRAWLAIIVDDDDQIEPLPNLDFKFVCADSLVPLDQARGLWSDPDLQEKMTIIREKFFNARTPEAKEERKRDYYKLATPQGNMFSDKREVQLKSFDPFKNQRPAMFFDPDYMFGVGQFDLVIGNPPYVHLEKMKDVAKEKYMPLKFKTYEARGDLYGLFFERGLGLLKPEGALAYITSNKWMRAGYGESLRDYFVQNTQPVLLIDLGGGIFESATVDTDILVLKKSAYLVSTRAIAASRELNSSNLEQYIRENTERVTFQNGESWVILSPIERSIKEKIEKYGTPLKEWDIKISRGILTGLNEAFIINEDRRREILDNCKTPEERERTDKIIRPILRGKDIKRGGYEWAGLYCICTFPAAEINIEDYSAVEEYFISADWSDEVPHGYGKLKLEQTGKEHVVNGIKFKSRKKTGNKWYETQDQIKYMDDFSGQKIIFSRISGDQPCFSLDDNKMLLNDTGYIITGNNLEYLLNELTSDIVWYAFKRFYMGGGINKEFKVNNLFNLPVMEQGALYHLTEEEIKFISSFVKL